MYRKKPLTSSRTRLLDFWSCFRLWACLWSEQISFSKISLQTDMNFELTCIATHWERCRNSLPETHEMFKRTLDLGLTSKEKRKWPCIQFYNRRCTNCDYPEGGKLSKCMKKRKFISLLLIYDLQLNIVSVFSEYYCLTLGQSAHLSAWCPPQSTFSPLILGTQFEFFQAQSPLHWYLNQTRPGVNCAGVCSPQAKTV